MKNKIINKKALIISSALLILVIPSIIIGNVFSNELLLPERATFEDGFNTYSKNINYDNEYYLKQSIESHNILSEDGYDLYAEYLKCPTESNKTIYYLHGYGVTRAQAIWFLEKYHELGYNVVMYDQIASGKSGGKYSTMGVKESRDLKTVKDYIENTYGKSEKVALHGISMGASTAIYYAEKYGDIDYILADCGYSTMKDIVIHQYKQQFNLPNFPFINLANIGLKMKANYTLNDVDCLQSIASDELNNVDIVIIHGAQDNFTPVHMAYDLQQASTGNSKLEIFENADHADCYQSEPQRYERIMEQLLIS